MEADAAAIRAEDLRVVRGGHEVLRGLDFVVGPGSLSGLIGPSGSGKSTLMRSIAGVQRNVQGTLTVLGMAAGTPALRSQIGYLTQAPSIYADLTVTENLEYFAAVLGAPRESVDEVLGTVKLTHEAGRLVGDLSGGERARVSLATALLGDPRLLLLDEPTVGLDPVLRHDLWDTFRRLAQRGITLFVSSHVMDEAELCDRVMLLRDGRMLAHDEPGRIREATGANRLDDAFLTLVRQEGERP